MLVLPPGHDRRALRPRKVRHRMRFRTIAAVLGGLAFALAPLGAGAASLPAAKPAPQQPYHAAVDSMRALWRGGDIRGSLLIAKRLRTQYPKDPDILFAYAQRSIAAGESTLVRDEFAAMERLEPTALSAYLSGLVAPVDSARVAQFRVAVQRDAGFAQAHLALAQMALSRSPQDTVTAIMETRKAIESDPSQWSSWRTLGYLALGRGDTTTARTAFRAVWTCDSLTFAPDDRINALITDARALAAKAPVSAAGLLAVLPAVTPDWADYNALGIYAGGGQGKKALALADENIAAAADANAKVQFLYGRAVVFAKLGMEDSAFVALNRAIDAGLRGPERLGQDPVFGNPWRAYSSSSRFADAAARLSDAPLDTRTPDEKRQQALANRLDQDIPPLGFTTPQGELLTLSSLRGKVVVLDFWATWCGPCRRTMPLLSQFTRAADSTKVVVLSAEIFERAADAHAKAQQMFRENDYAMRLVYSEDGYGELLGFNSIPTLMVIGPDGKLQWRHTGYSPDLPEVLKAQSDALLSEAAGK